MHTLLVLLALSQARGWTVKPGFTVVAGHQDRVITPAPKPEPRLIPDRINNYMPAPPKWWTSTTNPGWLIYGSKNRDGLVVVEKRKRALEPITVQQPVWSQGQTAPICLPGGS